MGLEQYPMRPVLVDYRCDSCNAGYMRPSGSINFKNGSAVVPHKCTACHTVVEFSEKYPTIRYAREGELLDLKNYVPNQI
jgi:hypothetical protein